jgi:hypothetical protein
MSRLLTGKDIYESATAELTRLNLPVPRPNEETVLQTINDVMAEIHSKVAIYVGRFTIDTESGYLYIVPYNEDGTICRLPDNAILKASNGTDGTELSVERPLTFPGAVGSLSLSELVSDVPTYIWQEYDEIHDEVLFGAYPVANLTLTIHLTLKMLLPSYEDWSRSLPVRPQAHQVVRDGVVRTLFGGGRDFHDNAQKAIWEAKFREGVAMLKEYEVKPFTLPSSAASSENWMRVT